MSSLRPHVLLLQPPSPPPVERDAPSPRWQGPRGPRWPWPLLVESARLTDRALVSVIDAQAQGLSAEAAFTLAEHLRPDAIFALVGGAACAEDPGFLVRLRERVPGASLAVGGPAVSADPAAALTRFEAADAAVTAPGAPGPSYEAGFGSPGALWRGQQAAADAPRPTAPWALGPPQLGLFAWARYTFDGWAGLVGQPMIALPQRGAPPWWRAPEALRVELQAWATAGAAALSLRGAPLPTDTPAQLDGLLADLHAVGLPWAAAVGASLPTPAQRAAIRAAGCRRIDLGVHLGNSEHHVIVEGQARSVAELRAALGPGAPPVRLRVDGLREPRSVGRALQLADALGAAWLDLRPDGAARPVPALTEAIEAGRRAAARRPARWRAGLEAALRGPTPLVPRRQR